MTRGLPFTQASVLRAIAALEKAGKRVKGVAPDGTVLVDNGDSALAPAETAVPDEPASKWEDARA